MKLRWKLLTLTLGTGVLLQFGNCAQFWGDTLADAFFLGLID